MMVRTPAVIRIMLGDDDNGVDVDVLDVGHGDQKNDCGGDLWCGVTTVVTMTVVVLMCVV